MFFSIKGGGWLGPNWQKVPRSEQKNICWPEWVTIQYKIIQLKYLIPSRVSTTIALPSTIRTSGKSKFHQKKHFIHWVMPPYRTQPKPKCSNSNQYNQTRKWNYPNRIWNYFSTFQASDQKTYFTKCFSFVPRDSKLIFKTGNGIIQTGNGIISHTSRPLI